MKSGIDVIGYFLDECFWPSWIGPQSLYFSSLQDSDLSEIQTPSLAFETILNRYKKAEVDPDNLVVLTPKSKLYILELQQSNSVSEVELLVNDFLESGKLNRRLKHAENKRLARAAIAYLLRPTKSSPLDKIARVYLDGLLRTELTLPESMGLVSAGSYSDVFTSRILSGSSRIVDLTFGKSPHDLAISRLKALIALSIAQVNWHSAFRWWCLKQTSYDQIGSPVDAFAQVIKEEFV